MDAPAILKTFENTAFAAWIRNSLYAFPMIESVHVIAITLVFGTIAIIDLRLLGLASVHRPFSRVAGDLKKWTWAAFLLAAGTGGLMFITNAAVYYTNTEFRAKMAMIALSGLNMLVFEWTLGRKVSMWDNHKSAPLAGKLAGAVSIVLWITVIFLGRWVGFTATANLTPTPDVNLEDLFN